MSLKRQLSVLERFMVANPMWQEGYKSFSRLFGKPLGWLVIIQDSDNPVLMRLDRASNCSFYSGSSSNRESVEDFLSKYARMQAYDSGDLDKLPSFYKFPFGRSGAIFALKHLGRLRGLLVFTSMRKNERQLKDYVVPFDQFLNCHVELAYKSFELNNFYETVHPRALALSTMHSVHRVISSSLRLNELLPKIGRLSAQVLKAKGCSILLYDMTREYLEERFSFGESKKFKHRQRVKSGRGIQGRVAHTGEFHLSRKAVCVPFIEDDVVGVITLWDKIDKQPFSRTDLEILKTLSEQAVVAIKNAQLYEETEQLTLGSIKTINELLELNFGGKRTHLPVFSELIIEVGKELQLSSRELTHLDRAIHLLDTGALALPEKFWHKKDKLTKKELTQIQSIPMRGASLLRSISSLKPVIPIILHHRERYDGKGYPQGLKKEEIPIGARIVSVVDSFIAMVSRRMYRATKKKEEAIKELLAHKGTQFDPHVVDAFIKVVRRKHFTEKVKMLSHK